MSYETCPHCKSTHTVGKGHTETGRKRRLCRNCSRSYVIDEMRDGSINPLPAAEHDEPGWHENGNDATLVSTPRLTRPTLEDILEEYAVDTDVWIVEKWGVKEYTVTMKLRTGGKDGDDTPTRVINYSVHARFVRRVPITCEWPVVKPGTLPKVRRAPAVKKRGGLRRAFVYSDPHFGHLRDIRTEQITELHDERALSVASGILKAVQPDLVVGCGDLLDNSDQTTHWVRRPEYAYQTQRGIDRAVLWLHEHRGYAGEWKEIQGNHDWRITDNVIQNLTASYALRPGLLPTEDPERDALSPERLLRLDDLGISYHGTYPDGEVWINENLVAMHGDTGGANPGQTATKNLMRPRCSLIIGHWHRDEAAHTTAHHHGGRKTYACHVVGCLCRTDGVVPGKNARPNWQQSVLVVEYDDVFFHVDHVPIYDGRAIYNGTMYGAEGITS